MLEALHTQLTAGQIFGGDYRVEQPLSAGGMGAVYVVTQLNTNRRRALKVMHPELAAHPKFRERFRQEAQVGASIHSEHVVEVVDAGVDTSTNMPFLAMELLDGADLADTVAKYGPLSREQIAIVYDQLCHALAAAHHVGVVHRDLKPENLFLARARRADSSFTLKILDFGIAKMVAEARTSRTATQTIGSPMWMAPEQTVAGSTITPQTDIWPLGLIAFFLLTGRPFWRAANTENPAQMMLLREVCFEPLPPLMQRAQELGVAHLLPAGFDAWFARCVAREPGDRFANVGQAHAALTPLLRAGAPPRTLQSPVYQPPVAQHPGPQPPGPQPAVPQPPTAQGGPMTLAGGGANVPTGAIAPHLVQSSPGPAAASHAAAQPRPASPTGYQAPSPTTYGSPPGAERPTPPPATPQPVSGSPQPHSQPSSSRPSGQQAASAPATIGPTQPPTQPGYPGLLQPIAGQPIAATQPGGAPPGAIGYPQTLPSSSTAEPVAVPSREMRPSRAPLFIGAALLAVGGIVGAVLLLGGDPTTDTSAETATKPAAERKAKTDDSATVEPPSPAPALTPDPSPEPSTATEPEPAASTAPSSPKPSPQGQWPKPLPNPVQPDPEPYQPPYQPPPTPDPEPQTPYGRPCGSRADCGPGYDCSYGGKCVPL